MDETDYAQGEPPDNPDCFANLTFSATFVTSSTRRKDMSPVLETRKW